MLPKAEKALRDVNFQMEQQRYQEIMAPVEVPDRETEMETNRYSQGAGKMALRNNVEVLGAVARMASTFQSVICICSSMVSHACRQGDESMAECHRK